MQIAIHRLQYGESLALLRLPALPTAQATAGLAALSDLAIRGATATAARPLTPHSIPRLKDFEGVLRVSKRCEFSRIHAGQRRSPFLESHRLELGEKGRGVIRNMAVPQVARSAMQAAVGELLELVGSVGALHGTAHDSIVPAPKAVDRGPAKALLTSIYADIYFNHG